MEGAVPTDTNGSFAAFAVTRVMSVTEPEPTATRNSVSGESDSTTSPTAVSSGTILPSRTTRHSVTEKPSAHSAASTSRPATS